MSVILSVLALLASLQAAAPPVHPLDALTGDEIALAVRLARADARLASAAFPSVALLEPAKADVLAWQPGRALPRQARIQAMTPAQVYDVVVDLTARRVTSVTERPGVEPSITYSEVEAAGLVLRDRRFVDGLRARGITDLTKLFCAPFAAGYYAIPAHEGKRLIRVGCFDTRRSTTNVFAWPIERLYGLVDLRRREVIEVTDGGVVPIAPGDLNYGEAAVGALRPRASRRGRRSRRARTSGWTDTR